MTRHLAHEQPTHVAALARRLHDTIEKNNRVVVSETEWRSDPDYQVPVAVQLEALQQIDPAILAKATEWFQKRKAHERRPPVKDRL